MGNVGPGPADGGLSCWGGQGRPKRLETGPHEGPEIKSQGRKGLHGTPNGKILKPTLVSSTTAQLLAVLQWRTHFRVNLHLKKVYCGLRLFKNHWPNPTLSLAGNWSQSEESPLMGSARVWSELQIRGLGQACHCYWAPTMGQGTYCGPGSHRDVLGCCLVIWTPGQVNRDQLGQLEFCWQRAAPSQKLATRLLSVAGGGVSPGLGHRWLCVTHQGRSRFLRGSVPGDSSGLSLSNPIFIALLFHTRHCAKCL